MSRTWRQGSHVLFSLNLIFWGDHSCFGSFYRCPYHFVALEKRIGNQDRVDVIFWNINEGSFFEDSLDDKMSECMVD